MNNKFGQNSVENADLNFLSCFGRASDAACSFFL